MGGAVAERRLRPLWDAIESRQYKSALKLASALQSKHPDAPYVVVLKALVLERLGKPDEALALCRQAKDMQPIDDMTLKALQLVYHRLGLLEESTLAYENACSKDPGNMELLISFFNCHVRQCNYVKQQQVAMKIYKHTGEEKYLFWAVCSIYLQVRPGNAAEKQLLALAEALLKKRIDANGLHDLEGLRLYISLYLAQNRIEDALGLVKGEMGALFNIPIERLKLQGELLMQMHKYSDAVETYREILSISSDDWTAIIQFINASLELTGDCSTVDKVALQLSSLSLSANETLERLGKVADFISSLQRLETTELRRGPFLAMVEIEFRRLLHGSEGSNATMALAASILNYFQRFGHLAGFFSDVKPYLLVLDPRSQEWLVNQLAEDLAALADTAGPVQLLRKEISACQVQEYTGHLGGDPLEVVRRLVRLYKDNLKYSVNLDPEENILGEEFLVMAASLLVKLFLQTRQSTYFLEAAAVLEFGLHLRRFSSHFKVMLVSLYSSIFATSLAVEWFRTLDVKNILLESASHHILPLLLAAPHSSALLNDTVKFHDDSQHEVAEMTIMTYRHGNYSKIVEFLELKERLENSHHYLLVRVELSIFSLKDKVEELDALEATLAKLENGNDLLKWSSENRLATLSFNEDCESRPWWSPVPDQNFLARSSPCSTQEIATIFPSSKAKAQVTATDHERWRASVKRRSLVPRLLYLSLNALSFEKDRDERREELRQHLEYYLKSLDRNWSTIDDFISECKVVSDHPVYKLKIPSHLILLLPQDEKLNLDVDAQLSILLFVLGWELASWSSSSEDRIVHLMALVGKTLTTGVTNLLQSCDDTLGFGTGMPALVKVITEPVSWLVLSAQAWTKKLQPSSKKKRRGPSEPSEDTRNASRIVDGLRGLVASTTSAIERVVLWLTKRSGSREEDEVEALLLLLRSGSGSGVVELLEGPSPFAAWKAEDLATRIVASQREEVSRLGEVCKSRLKILVKPKF
ncbi:N-terminal acetyltransferase B complex auxiliary subunit NAA25 isoform X2 [Selaginella moellendorffii]|uniref:N-terminal acetyltransferase B complex auxiliary subunit NAA25 isoform X2 n=1 Tax=Selaginella moellendorffii TaxID=88036 RepID=UPI000D1D07D6|nr:N-terminal acetyltransferase B complex auxiliary subunit NAA25 isoform X2 [Selaginella moellendorffii]|eukprot:XP_024531557.1 N-terminal acetyltransferase B complex auxiliary subunit NAA25 isoform X2 [Selaginella moellendorffii]